MKTVALIPLVLVAGCFLEPASLRGDRSTRKVREAVLVAYEEATGEETDVWD
jgi:hypothetical protein